MKSNRRNYNSEVFTATRGTEDTYDAYERDIAIVSFYFKKPTVFEYTRYMVISSVEIFDI